jgi:hypothetical protein
VDTTFADLDNEAVAALGASDPAVKLIWKLRETQKPISFSWLRTMAGRDRDLWNQLSRGTAILATPALARLVRDKRKRLIGAEISLRSGGR